MMWILAAVGVAFVGGCVGWVIGSLVALLRDDSMDWDDEDVYL